MIDIRRIRFDGKLNYQNGLSFYFSRQGHVISFLIQEIGDRKRRIRVRMEPDVNHERAHVHINEHNASFDVNTGELMEGECDVRTRQTVQNWILRHKGDLLELWDIAKAGIDYRPYVRRIREDKDFTDFGFKGTKPDTCTIIERVKIWYEGELIQELDYNNVNHVISEGDMFVGLPEGFLEGRMIFESLNGKVQVK